MPTLTEFKTRFPELDHPDDTIEEALTEAVLIHSLDDTITGYVAAHLLAIRPDRTGTADGGSGEVKAERIGPRRVEYATMAKDGRRDVFFATSSYGRMVLTLEDRHPQLVIASVIV